MERRYRLTRSQDFDAVYRKGRSRLDAVPRTSLVPA